jgi:hypothetical protein
MATVEYAALALLVSAAVGAGGASLGGEGSRVAEAVGDGVRRALCTVAGGGCDSHGRSRACTVSSLARRRDAHVDIAFVRLSDGRRVLRERLSDGSVRVTVVEVGGVGGVVGLGARLTVGGVDARARAEAAARVGGAATRVFEVADDMAADRLMARLDEQDWAIGGALRGLVRFAAGRGDEDERERGFALRVDGDGDAVVKALGLDAVAGSSLLERAAGVRVDGRTGERTLVLGRSFDGGAEVDAKIARLAGGVSLERTFELVLDRENRPRSFILRAAGGVRGEANGQRAELDAHLDLADPAARALSGRLLHGDVRAFGPLVSRLWDDARIEHRRYATTLSERSSGASLGAGAKAGYEITRSSATAKLVSASGRDPGGVWTRRLDCELAAGAPLA